MCDQREHLRGVRLPLQLGEVPGVVVGDRWVLDQGIDLPGPGSVEGVGVATSRVWNCKNERIFEPVREKTNNLGSDRV